MANRLKVTCLSLDCPERTGGECDVLERLAYVPPEKKTHLFQLTGRVKEGKVFATTNNETKCKCGVAYWVGEEPMPTEECLESH